MEEFYIPTGEAEAEYIEKRSRFIGHIFQTETEEEAVACIKRIREQHWDARHHVFAYIIRGGAMRYSDDGEPQGTAGQPVLEVLRRSELKNVCCVVTRYFGGILLGAGGLTRAYAKSAKLAVDAAGISIQRVWNRMEIPCPYALYERLRQQIAAFDGQILDTQYGAQVQLTVVLPQVQVDPFLSRMADLSAGSVEAVQLGQEYRAFPIAK